MPRSPRSNARIMQRASELRNDLTDPEALLWNYLRLKRLNKIRFRRQHAIGRYVVDFCAPDAKLVIELDGSQHIQQAARDVARTKYLEAQGYRVLRFWNDQVLKDINGVVSTIQDALEGSIEPVERPYPCASWRRDAQGWPEASLRDRAAGASPICTPYASLRAGRENGGGKTSPLPD